MTEDIIARETERVRLDWSLRGKHWDAQADLVAETADRFNQPLIEAAGIAAGHMVLDLATGAGEPALSVAKLTGPEGRVCATDLVPEMIAGAERRAHALGLDNIDFRVADMCALPDGDETFDRAICRFGLMFVPEPQRATAEVHRVLKPGGQAAFLVWGPRADTTMFTVFADAAVEMWGPDDPLVDFDTMCSMGETGALEAALRTGGFDEAEEIELRFAPKIPAHLEPWHAQVDMSLGPKLDTVDEAEREKLKETIREGFQRHNIDGELHMTAHARIGVGRKR